MKKEHVSRLKRTWHEGEAAGQLHDSGGGAGGLQDGSISADVAVGRHGRQVVGDGERGSAAHLHGGGRGGRRRWGAARSAWQAGHRERRLQGVLLWGGGDNKTSRVKNRKSDQMKFEIKYL